MEKEKGTKKTKLALATIVKDESQIIERMIKNIMPFVDGIFIGDTGSSDNTKEVMEKALGDFPHKIIDVKWRGFSKSRNKVLSIVPKEYEYILVIDADEIILRMDVDRNGLTEDMYGCYVTNGWTSILGARIFRNHKKIKYEGAIHNQLVGFKRSAPIHPDNMMIDHIHDGKRADDPNKLSNDVEKLKLESAGDKFDAKHEFFLAETLWAMGRKEEAVGYYERVSQQQEDNDFVYHSHFMLGLWLFEQERFIESKYEMMDAYALRKTLEPLYYLILIAESFGRQKYITRLLSASRKANLAAYIVRDIRDYLYELKVAELYPDKKWGQRKCRELLERNLGEEINTEINKVLLSLQ